jgi:hypothetical protein
MPRFRNKPIEVEAVQLTWQTWGEVCELLPDPFPEGMRGVAIDADGNTHDQPAADDRIGLLITGPA